MLEATKIPFDPLRELSEARTALEKIDGVIGALSCGHGNDLRDEARWTLKHLGQLIADVSYALESEEGVAEGHQEWEAIEHLTYALDYIDSAIGALS